MPPHWAAWLALVLFFVTLVSHIGCVAKNASLKRELRERRVVTPEMKKPKDEPGDTYGHPLPPVQTLYDALPPPPPDHAWEILVENTELDYESDDQNGRSIRSKKPSLALTCRLVKLAGIASHPDGTMNTEADTQVVASFSKDLLYSSWYTCASIADDGGRTWLSGYRNKYKDDQIRDMRREFIGPFTDWAHTSSDIIRVRTMGNNGEYRMKGA